MKINRKKIKKSPVRASKYTRPARAIKADDEMIEDEIVDDVVDDVPAEEGGEGDVVVDPEATDLLFETEDVCELLAEVTGETVEATADEDVVTFTIGDTDFTVEAEGDEEVLEATRKVFRGKKKVAASTRTRRPAKRPAGKPARKVSK